jgi:hypothetical protein
LCLALAFGACGDDSTNSRDDAIVVVGDPGPARGFISCVRRGGIRVVVADQVTVFGARPVASEFENVFWLDQTPSGTARATVRSCASHGITPQGY